MIKPVNEIVRERLCYRILMEYGFTPAITK